MTHKREKIKRLKEDLEILKKRKDFNERIAEINSKLRKTRKKIDDLK